MIAVHFGAGNIGRGFIGSLLYQSGFATCFVDVNDELVHLLNERGEYKVSLAGNSAEELIVKDVQAINSKLAPHKVIDMLTKADLVTTAVGPSILPIIADLLAKGLSKRLKVNKQPLHIIACENMIGGGNFLQEMVYEKIRQEEKRQFEQLFSFPNAAVDRIVPHQTNEDKLMVMVEPFYEWIVDQRYMIGIKPRVKGMKLVDDLTPYIERKLFTVNTGHAVAAYLGYVAGIATIAEAMKNENIVKIVRQTLKETGRLLIKKYNFDQAAHAEYIDKIMERFSNPYLSDEVTRVARSPIRKLGPNDRLIAPAREYMEMVQEEPVHLAQGIAAALMYDYPQDQEAVQLQQTIKAEGLEYAIESYTSLSRGTPLVDLIVQQFRLLKKWQQEQR